MKLKTCYFLAILATMAILRGAVAQDRVLPTDITNIAAAANGGRVLNATSILDDDKDYDPSNLISGQVFDVVNNTGTKGWASNKFDPINMESVTLAFKDNSVHSIGKIVLNPDSAVTPERWAKDIEVQVSTDTAEGPYQAVAQLTLQQKAVPQSFLILPVDARFVRLAFRSNWGSDRSVALGQIEIYEAIDTSDPLGQLIARLEGTIRELTNYRKTQIDASNAGGQVVAAPNAPAADAGAANPGPAALHGGAGLSEATVQTVQMFEDDESGGATFPVSKYDIAAASAGGHIVAYSSIFDNDRTYGPDTLISGQVFDMNTGKGPNGWASEGFSPGKEFVTLAFKDELTKLVGKIVVNPASNQADLRWARRIDVQATVGASDAGPWRTVATLNVQDKAIPQEFIIRPVEAKYLRFVFMANGPGDIPIPDANPNVDSDRAVSLGQIQVFEALSSNDQLTGIISKLSQILNDMKSLHDQEKANNQLATPAFFRNPNQSLPSPRPAVATTHTNAPAKPHLVHAVVPAKPAESVETEAEYLP